MSALAAQQTALLRPIFDSLDTGNASAGLRHCDRALLRIKSGPNYHTVLALKSFLLVKLRRATEADALCLSLENMVPESEIALKYMRIVMQYFKRETTFPEIVTKAYEKRPEDQGLAMLSCESYIRIRDWASVQKVSFKMYSKFNDPKMIWWSASSIYLQTLNPDTLPSNVVGSLTLAHRLTTSIKTPPSPSQIWLSARILVSLAKLSPTEATPSKIKYLEDALNYLESEEVQKVLGNNRDLELEELRWEIVELLGNEQADHQVWVSEWERLRKFILGEGTETKDTNYLTYQHLITLSIKLYGSRSELLSQISDVFKTLAKEAGQVDRGPLLARLELAWQIRELKATESQEDTDVSKLTQAYFQAFSGKACCYEDLKPYLPTDNGPVESLLEFLDENAGSSESIKDLQRHINVLKIRRYLSSSSDDKESVQTDLQIADHAMNLYKENLHLGDQLVDTELQPVDDLAIIAANSLIHAWSISRDISYLYKAVTILEYAQKASKVNHYFRLILIKLYRLLGAPILTHALYVAIKVGFVQQDTMSHLLLSRAATFGTESDGIDFSSKFEDVLRYFDASETDLPDAIITAFERQSYPQIEDFVQFHISLQTSLQHQIVQLESSRWNHLSFAQSDESIKEDMKSFEGTAISNGSKDNRDFGLMPSYQPRGSSSLELLSGTGPEIEIRWLKIMQGIYQSVLHKAIGSQSNGVVLSSDAHGLLTVDEQALVELARVLVSSETGCKPKPEEEAIIVKFFEERKARLLELTADQQSATAATGWELLHLGSIALEGYVLLDLLASRSQPGPNGKRQPLVSVAHPTILSQSRSILKSLASQLKNTSDKIGSAGSRKEVTKQCAGLEAMGINSDDRLPLDVASQITLSRKAALMDLARRMTHRLTQSNSS